MGRGHPGLMKWILLWNMPLVQDRSRHMLTISPMRYHCTTDAPTHVIFTCTMMKFPFESIISEDVHLSLLASLAEMGKQSYSTDNNIYACTCQPYMYYSAHGTKPYLGAIIIHAYGRWIASLAKEGLFFCQTYIVNNVNYACGT